LPTAAGTARALRRRPAPGLVVIVIALIGAFLVSRGCQRSQVRISKDQAVALGQRQLDFKPRGHAIRMILRGVPPKRYWVVSYFIRKPRSSDYRKLVVLLISANTGKIQRIK
jgi:hypothetical protein